MQGVLRVYMPRVAAVAACLVLALVAALTSVGVLSCYGDSCSYTFDGYITNGPGALYGVVGTVAATASAVCLGAAIAAARAARFKTVLHATGVAVAAIAVLSAVLLFARA